MRPMIVMAMAAYSRRRRELMTPLLCVENIRPLLRLAMCAPFYSRAGLLFQVFNRKAGDIVLKSDIRMNFLLTSWMGFASIYIRFI